MHSSPQKRPSRAVRPSNVETPQDMPLIKKKIWKAGTVLSPVPVVLVSCGGSGGHKPNIVTVAWAGTVCSDPPMLSISLRPQRFSYGIIADTREFAVNIPSADQAKVTDWCGVKSGRDVDKFSEMNLTPLKGKTIEAPLIMECPISLECKVKRIVKLGSHDLFLATIEAVQVTEELIDKAGKLRLDKANLLAYAHGEYFALGRRLGFFCFSVKRPGTRRS